MSFKMVAGKINLFSLIGWDENTKRKFNLSSAYAWLIRLGILTYCYVFTNMNTRQGYKVIFKDIFDTLREAGRGLIYFPHIHFTDNGIRTIGLDMCKKQASGEYMLCIC
jgi:hypothetical protein